MLQMSRGRLYISQILTYSLTMLLNCESLLEIIIKCRFLSGAFIQLGITKIFVFCCFLQTFSICNYVNACTSVIRFLFCWFLLFFSCFCFCFGFFCQGRNVFYQHAITMNRYCIVISKQDCAFCFVLFLKALYKALPTLKHKGVFVYASKPVRPSSRQKARLCKCFNYYFQNIIVFTPLLHLKCIDDGLEFLYFDFLQLPP